MKPFIIFIFFVAFYISISTADSCYTPDNIPGICKSIHDCRIFVEVLQKNHLSNSTVDYLRKTKCGFSGDVPIVCCPNTTTPFVEESSLLDLNAVKLLPSRRGCGYFSEDKIISGENAKIGEFPWNALLEYKTSDGTREFYCGGSLISDRYILTAAHCVVGNGLPEDTELISVRLGDINIKTDPDCTNFFDSVECSDPVLNIPVEETIVHENYNLTNPVQNHDIALVRLKNKVTFSDFVSPICLPVDSEQNPHSRLRVAGWGAYNKKPLNIVKKTAFISETNRSVCNSVFNLKIGDDQICGVKQKYSPNCMEDIGGALHGVRKSQYFLMGVLSYGPTSCKNETNVYINVKKYVHWIINNLKE